MLGFILGAAVVIGVGRMLRRRAWYGRFGHGAMCQSAGLGGYGYGGDGMRSGMGWHGRGGLGGGRARGPAAWALRSLFERLETTPGQERVIVSALDELRENRRVVRDEMKQTKGDLARAIARHDRLLAQLRVGFVEALKKMTEVLDEPQRKQLAQWLEGGFFRRGWGGPGGVWA
jgi:hypothetical protein